MKMQRSLTAKRLFITAALLLLSSGAAIGSGTAFGFVVGRPSDLEDALRWSNVPGSLVEQGVRGLGGGIEYAIADDFCEQVIPAFLDEPKPTCDQLKEIIKRAFDKWAAGHPVLRFVDVTGKIKPERPPQGRDPARGYGAEIDIFAGSAGGYPAFAPTYYRRDSQPIGTNGKELPGHTITNADIVVFGGWCFFIDLAFTGQRQRGLPCWNFESTMMHEIGHTLGLHHPWEFPMLNYDSDDDPTNEIPIDCEDPTKGLKLSPNVAPFAIMGGAHPDDKAGRVVLLELQNDDIGGRNFLYPICPSAAQGGADLASPAAPLFVNGEGPGVRYQTRPVWGD
jgi:hypothetical protein